MPALSYLSASCPAHTYFLDLASRSSGPELAARRECQTDFSRHYETVFTSSARSYAQNRGAAPLDPPVGLPEASAVLLGSLDVEALALLAKGRSWERAWSLLDTGTFSHYSADESGAVSAQVLSPSGNTYTTTLAPPLKESLRDLPVTSCTCPAAEKAPACKHAIALGLALLGYQSQEASEVPDVQSLSETRSDSALLETLTAVEQQMLLAAAMEKYPSVRAAVGWKAAEAHGFAAQQAAARRSVDASLVGFNYDRRWKYEGQTAAAPLEAFCAELSLSSLGVSQACALLDAGCYAIAELNVTDRYGDVLGVIAQCLDFLVENQSHLTSELVRALARSLASLATAPNSDMFSFLLANGEDYGYDRSSSIRALLRGEGFDEARRAESELRLRANPATDPTASKRVHCTRQAQADQAVMALDALTRLLALEES